MESSEQVVTPQVLIDTGRSRFWVIENFTPDLYPQLQQAPTIEEPPIMVMGRQVRQRRDVSFFSDESEGYRYSGQIMPSMPLNTVPIFPELLSEINRSLGTSFNGILVNRYRTGEKYLSAHSDSEIGLDPHQKTVAGLAYGPGVRLFRIRNKATKQIVLDYPHQPRTLIVMDGDFQQEFTHEIPVQKRVTGERISVTFRHHTQ